jgi:NAD(P)-dependent dehydrogenase (short-subunit alcohol dehydrogenase family)
MWQLRERVAAVTGAASGIGLAIARRGLLVEEGIRGGNVASIRLADL